MRFLDRAQGKTEEPRAESAPVPPLAALRAVVELRGSLGWRLFLEALELQIQAQEARMFSATNPQEVVDARSQALALAAISRWPEVTAGRYREELERMGVRGAQNVPNTTSPSDEVD